MQNDTYQIETSESFLKFEFYSIGPKGKVKKQVHFTRIDINLFNLGFGDIDSNGKLNDMAITNNEDRQVVLFTVALTIYKFCEKYPNSFVFAQGSTKSRTRLYQIGISNNLEAVIMDFQIYDLYNNYWESFQKGKNYEAFLVKRKNL